MSLFKIDLPPSFTRFRSDSGSIDFSKLEKEPNKVVKFILLSRKKLESSRGLEKSVLQAMLETFQTTILKNPNLSDYHFAKLVCRCPELFALNQEKLKERVTAFFNSLSADPDNTVLLRQAKKISNIISLNPALNVSIGYPLTRSFKLKDGSDMTMARFLWAEKIPAYRPILIGNFEQKNPLDLTYQMVVVLEQFIEKSTLPDLTFDELLLFVNKARELQFQQLQKACYQALKNHINEENVLPLLVSGLNDKNEQIIKDCIKFLRERVPNIEFSWTPDKGLKVDLRDLNDNSRAILNYLHPYIPHMTISNPKVVPKLVAQNIIFSETRTLEVLFNAEPQLMNALGQYFPHVRKCLLFSIFYKRLKPENVANFSELEILSLRGEKIEDETLFPHLKLCIQPSSRNEKAQLEEKKGKLFFESALTDELDLSHVSDSTKNLVTDEILEELLKCRNTKTDLRALRLNGCHRLTDKFRLLFPTLLKNLKVLSLKDCSFTDRTGLAIATHLDLSELYLMSRNISDRTGVAIANRLKNLAVLTIGSPQFSDESGVAIACSLQNLSLLSFVGCSNLTDKTGAAVATHQQNLMMFIAKSSKFTDQSGVSIAKNLKKLHFLALSESEHLTDQTGFAIAANLPELVELHLDGCPNITQKSIKGIIAASRGKLKRFLVDEDSGKLVTQNADKRQKLEEEEVS